MSSSASLYNFSDFRPYWKYFSMDGVFYEEMRKTDWTVYAAELPDMGFYDRGR